MIGRGIIGIGISALAFATANAAEVPKSAPDSTTTSDAAAAPNRGVLFHPVTVKSEGSVTVEGRRIDYQAVAGTIVVHPKGWDDAAWREEASRRAAAAKQGNTASAPQDLGDAKNPDAEASMFYTAYFKHGEPAAGRPITFLYNGGPGSATVWLHIGAFGPRRVLTPGDTHLPAAPYRLVDNAYSLLDASDLVFIDAPGTGFSRIAGKDKEKSFYGLDPDAYAFGEFIKGFLSQYGRWNSPKYLFGESYGTPRSAVVVNNLETHDDVDFNGVILLSQILNFALSADEPEFNPGSDEAYITSLPTYAATAWYHNRLAGPRPADLETFMKEAEQFATGDYAAALQAGGELDPARRQAVAQRYAGYTGLPVDYVLRANLRVNGGEFSKTLQAAAGITTGRLDTRFSGPDLDPLSQGADYDPQSASISSAYVSLFNGYARDVLHYGADEVFKPAIYSSLHWDMAHQPPGAGEAIRGVANVMPDIANAMKYNPRLQVMVAGGYYDLATPFYEGWYEMHHLPVSPEIMSHISFKYYPSGHMVYAAEESLHALHDDVAAFIARTH